MAPSQRNLAAWIPNAVTSGNLLLGFFSILISLRSLREGQGPQSAGLATACWLILWATIGDVLDGKLAKLLKASSDFGMRLDTFADAVTFGLAPAVLLYAAFLSDPGHSIYIALAPSAYFLAACYRLARYNVQTGTEPRFGFTGVPTPTAAIIAATLYLSTRELPWPPNWVAVLTALLAVSMVSPLRYPALKGLKPRETVVVLLCVAAMLLAGIRYSVPQVVFATVTSFALVWGYWWIPLRPLWVPGVSRQD